MGDVVDIHLERKLRNSNRLICKNCKDDYWIIFLNEDGTIGELVCTTCGFE